TAKELLSEENPSIIRFMMLSAHYRSPIDYSEKLKEQAKNTLEKISTFAQRIRNHKSNKDTDDLKVQKFIKEFFKHMDDDFNSPRAIASLFELINYTNAKIDSYSISNMDKKNIAQFLKNFEKIFGIKILIAKKELIPEDLINLAKERDELRKNKQWKEGDERRDAIEKRGYKIEDTPEGPKLKKI
ncbi:MAG: DALR domain-containing protein, partial [Patescibacteria group bacterium]